jgi:hypothetical protein
MADWFAPKRYGYGAGLPIAWQGWVLTVGYLAVILLASLLAPHSLSLYLAFVFTLTGLFLLVASKTTRGGWRWRKGEKD